MSNSIMRLQNAVQSDAVHHLLIVSGNQSQKLEQVAHSLAAAWLNASENDLSSLPDFVSLKCHGKIAYHSAASIRSLVEQLSFQPFSGKRRAIVILEAERMLASSSNALLKSFEEPDVGTIFILTTTKIEKILPTIRSRGQTVRIQGDEDRVRTLPDSIQPLVDSFWNASPDVEKIYALTREIEKSLTDERDKRKKERLKDFELLPKALLQEIEAELEGESTQAFQEIGSILIEELWCRFRQKWVEGSHQSKAIFQETFGKRGRFSQALTALDRGMPLASVLMILL